jgi:hypothetical protein
MSEKEILCRCRSNPAVGNFLILFTLLMGFVFYKEGKDFPLSLDIVIPLLVILLWWGGAITVGNINVRKSGLEIKYLFHRKFYKWDEFSGYHSGLQYDIGLPRGKENEIHLMRKNEKPITFSSNLYKNIPELTRVVSQFLPLVSSPDFVKWKDFGDKFF